MANKQNNADNAVLMAILQDIQSFLSGNPIGSAASTAAIAQADIKRDKADKGDIHRIVTNQLLPIIDKIRNLFAEYPQLVEKLNSVLPDKNFDPNNITESNLSGLANMITYYLQNNGIKVFAKGGQFETQENWIEVQIGNKVYHLLVAETEEEKERGLQDVESMEPNEGMLFDYSDDPQASISFWMKDTTIPLDIVFVNQDGVVISVKQGEPLSEELITEDSEFVSCVIELNINSGVQPGDKTDLFEELASEEAPEEEPGEELEDESEEDEYPDVPINRLHVYGPDGDIQAYLQGGERIFSRKSTKVIIRKAKKCYMTKDEKDYKALGRYVFGEMHRQDNREPEYVDN